MRHHVRLLNIALTSLDYGGSLNRSYCGYLAILFWALGIHKENAKKAYVARQEVYTCKSLYGCEKCIAIAVAHQAILERHRCDDEGTAYRRF